MNRLIKLNVLILLALGCLNFSCGRQSGTLRVAHLCDPQLGFGKDGFGADSARFEQAVRQINALSPDVVVIAGDMVNSMDDEQAVRVITEQIARIRPPVVLTAGNHDLPDPVTAEGLKRYRAVFGDDFRWMTCKGRDLVSANSQLWREAPPDERAQHSRKSTDAP